VNRRQRFWAKIDGFWSPLNKVENMPALERPHAKTPEEARKLFRSALTDYVAQGWRIEIENEFDAVISRKRHSGWIGKFIVFLILVFLWFPLAIFYLVIAIIASVNARPKTKRIFVDEDGYIQIT
jgi:hypothetical protein